MAKLQAGDKIAYAAKFLKNTGQHTGYAPQRRGVFLKYDSLCGHEKYARVQWDDIDSVITSGQGQYADAEYVEDIRQNGSLVLSDNIAKIGSAKFALNDL
ncbi:MAG: hypothetical protein KGI54_16125 [Pseudomonadota bacterium]|nr:hypothetical protein [Pseudomonadota bacterium]